MNTIELIAIIGSIASLLGLVVAWIQTTRLRKLKRRKNADTWLAIREILSIVRGLNDPTLDKNIKDNTIIGRTYGRAISLHRQLLKNAILDEQSFDELTIKIWIKVGKLEEEWQENEARKFLTTEDIIKKQNKKMRERILKSNPLLDPPESYKDLHNDYLKGKISSKTFDKKRSLES